MMDVQYQLAILQAAAVVRQGMQQQNQARHNYTQHLDEQAVRNGAVEGTLILDGPGEATAELHFPVCFLERPVFTYGFELAKDAFLTDGEFPIGAATVYGWITKGSPINFSYVGVKVAIVFLAPINYVNHGDGGVVADGGTAGELHYSFRGQSFTNPIAPNTSVTGTI